MNEPNGQPHFEVSSSKLVLEQLKTLLLTSNQKHALIHSLKAIHSRLQKDPRIFGEPLYRLKHLRLEIRVAAIAPLAVRFGVHLDRPFVLVQRFEEMLPAT